MASLLAKFRMLEIERYMGIGCPRIHLRLYSTVMRAHGLHESQLITLFSLSLSESTQRWFASLESSRRRTWDNLAQEFLRQFSFNIVVDVSRRELEALRHRSDESISSFISRWAVKITQIVDKPLQRRDLVLRVIRGLIRDPRGKFRPNWSRPYFISELTPEGAVWLMDLDGNRFSEPINVDQLKKYYV